MGKILTIGIVGGMSPESTVTYYRHIVHKHQLEYQDSSYPRIVIASVSFQQYIDLQHKGAWDQVALGLEEEFLAVAAAGADFAILATNTMHKVLPDIKSPIPILSILDAVTSEARAKGIKSLGLTGTKFTMSDGFYTKSLEANGLGVIVPTAPDQEVIHRAIYEELIHGRVEPSSVKEFIAIAQGLSKRGADAVLLACTELELLVRHIETEVQMLDSTQIHANAAWEVSVSSNLSHALLL